MRGKMTGWEFATAWTLVAVLFLVFGMSACAGWFTPQDQKMLCQMNMKQVAQALEMYSAENSGRYPSIPAFVGEDCTVPNDSVMMFSGKQMFPEYLDNFALVVCPDDSDDVESVGDEWQVGADGLLNPCLVDNTSYFYFGWAVPETSEAGLAQYVAAVSSVLQEKAGYDAAIAYDDAVLCRLAKPPASCTSTAPAAQTPVLMDEFAAGDGIFFFNHIPGGSNVLFADGHVEFVQYQNFPLQEPLGEFLYHLGE